MSTELKFIEHFVPNYTKGHERPVKFGILHFVSCRYYDGYKDDPYNMEGILKLFDEDGAKYQFSCHYIISREGTVYQLVRLEDTSWNAGKSVIAIPQYMESLNPDSIAIELVGMEGDNYTTAQYQSLAKLAVHIEDEVLKLNIGQIDHWVGHDWVSGEITVKLGMKEKSKMKVDPGILFDWDVFLREKYRVRLDTEVRSGAKHELKAEIVADMKAGECLSLWFSKVFNGKKK